MTVLVGAPLTKEAYAPFGDVIMALPAGAGGKSANQGSAQRFDHLAALEDLRPGKARANVAVFGCRPRALPFYIELLEKHPASTQMFIPMDVRRYLVVVALGAERPNVSSMRAFVASGRQGITYRPGIWHHPLIALDAEAQFCCLVWEDGTSGDCVEFPLAEGERMLAVLPP